MSHVITFSIVTIISLESVFSMILTSSSILHGLKSFIKLLSIQVIAISSNTLDFISTWEKNETIDFLKKMLNLYKYVLFKNKTNTFLLSKKKIILDFGNS